MPGILLYARFPKEVVMMKEDVIWHRNVLEYLAGEDRISLVDYKLL